MSLDEFLECFPTVRRDDAVAVLEHSKSELLAEARAADANKAEGRTSSAMF